MKLAREEAVRRPPLVAWNDALVAALAHGTVVTPTRRWAREIAYAVEWQQARDGAQAGRTPDVQSVDAFLAGCYAAARDSGAPGADAALLPDDIASFAMARAAPDAGWAAHTDVLAAAWRTAKLHGVPSTEPALKQTENGAVYARWAQAFEALLRQEGWITSPELPDRLVRLTDGPGGWRPPLATVFTVEAPTPALRRFLIAAHCEQAAIAQGPPARCARRLAARDGGDELALAAVWARERLSANANARIGVVLAALGGAFPAIERRFHALFPDVADAGAYVNVSGGRALDQEPVCRDALALLACTVGADRATWRGVAQSPFLRLGLPPAPLPAHADMAGLAARSNAPGLRRLAHTLREGRGNPPWTPLIRRLLQRAGWASGYLHEREAGPKAAFNECLDAFALAERVAAFRDWDAAVAGLRRLASGRVFGARTGAAPIQVLGRAESAGLLFDHLWLAGLGQADWPPVPAPNPLLPLVVQRRAGVPALSLDDEWQRARAVTEQWRRSAGDVVASHSGVDAAPSLLVADFHAAERGDIVAHPSLALHGHPWAVATPGALAEWIDENAGPLASAKQAGGAAVLEDQSLCPFRAWARHRLGLQDPSVRGRFPNAAERGAVVHEILAALLTRFPQRDALVAAPPDAIAEAVEAALAKQRRWPALYREREARRLEGLAAEWLAQEEKRPHFTTLAVEQAATARVGGLELDLRIDRVDALPPKPSPDAPTGASKPLLLIDFKTGRVHRNDWRPPRPAAPQLPLYAVALADEPAQGAPCGIAFAQVRPGETRLTGVGDAALADTGLEDAMRWWGKPFTALREAWTAAVTDLAHGFATGCATVDPQSPAVCARCHLHALCRVDDGA